LFFYIQGTIEQISTIECFTCNQALQYHCPLPLNLDAGDESYEDEIVTNRYGAGFACMVGNFNRKINESIC
jgi:hypothetical protein